MKFISATSTQSDISAALDEIVSSIAGQRAEGLIDLALVFMTEPFLPDVAQISAVLHEALEPRHLLGCSAESIIGRGIEIEETPGITLIVAQLPAVTITPFAIGLEQWQDLLNDPLQFENSLPMPDDAQVIIMLGDPFTTPINPLLEMFNTVFPEVPIVGGMASAARQAGENILFFDGELRHDGVIGIVLAGNLSVDVIVSQGCRPIGQPYTVEAVEDNVIIAMGGEPPMIHLQRVLAALTEDEVLLARNGIMIGRAVNADEDNPGRGDFLIRSVMGVDQTYGALAVGDYMQLGEQVQFHVRDAATAEEDLSLMLAPQAFYEPPQGAFLFSCNGRGTRLFNHPNGDISTVEGALGEIPIAGFFAAGELGPIGGRNFLHGHTASMVLFRPRED